EVSKQAHKRPYRRQARGTFMAQLLLRLWPRLATSHISPEQSRALRQRSPGSSSPQQSADPKYESGVESGVGSTGSHRLRIFRMKNQRDTSDDIRSVE